MEEKWVLLTKSQDRLHVVIVRGLKTHMGFG